MFNHPLFQALCGGLLAATVGYLINQLPAIKNFPGKNALVFKLTIEVIILVGIYSLWNTTENKSHELEILLATVGGIALVFLVWHTFKLIWMLRKTKTNNSTDNTTTKLKSPNDWRRELLKVMKIEVEKRLNDSLYHGKIIRVGRENKQKAVGRNSVNASLINNQPSKVDKFLQPLRSLEVFRGRKTQLESGKPIIAAFDESDIAGRLLILGNPGAGKTTLLLELARDLIIRAENNPDYPIPVLFELTNWRDDNMAIANWLKADLKSRYNIPEKITHEWLSTEKLVPLLDGLDELGLSRQKKCIDKINEFLQSSSSLLPLVVCCREEEYQQGEAILNKLRGAVCLQPLSERQIQDYLRELKCKHLWEGIKNDADGLGELAKTPLFLNLIPVAYPDGLVSKGKRFNSEDERKEYQDKCRKELFDKYIEMRLGEHDDKKAYKAEDVKRWLVWLAKTMKEHKLKEFYIEKMQPRYLDNWKQRILYSLFYGLTSGMIFGRIYGLIFGVFIEANTRLYFGLLCVIIIGSLVGFVELIQHRIIQPMETIKFGFNLYLFIFFGLLIGLYTGLASSAMNSSITNGLISGRINNPLSSGLITGLVSGLIIGLMAGIDGTELLNKNYANQGIKESAKNTLMLNCIALPLLILLILNLSIQFANINTLELIVFSLGLTILLNIAFGGIPVIQHSILRFILWKNRSIPWNYARFLKYADERKLINQVGGRFTFIHDKLQEHFARM